MTTHQPPRPTSSPPRPHPRDDLPQVTSSLVPLPYGGTRSQEPSMNTTQTTTPPRPRDEVKDDLTCDYCAAYPSLPCALHRPGHPLGLNINAGPR